MSRTTKRKTLWDIIRENWVVITTIVVLISSAGLIWTRVLGFPSDLQKTQGVFAAEIAQVKSELKERESEQEKQRESDGEFRRVVLQELSAIKANQKLLLEGEIK